MISRGRSLGLYAGRQTEDCRILEIDTTRGDYTSRAADKGSANKPTRTERLRNSITPQRVDRLIKAESGASQFRESVTPHFYLFTIRLPSDALPLRRALPADRLLSGRPVSDRALHGVRDFQGHRRLVPRLDRRKKSRDGFTSIRPSF